MHDNVTFADRLRHLRALAGMTQAQLATSAKVRITQIQDAESGLREPNNTTVQKLARALGEDPEQLGNYLYEVREGKRILIQQALDELIATGEIEKVVDETGEVVYRARRTKEE